MNPPTEPQPIWRGDLPPVPGRHARPEAQIVYVDRFNWPPFLSKWWFWVIVLFMVVAACAPTPEYHASQDVDSGVSTTTTGDHP